MCDFDSVKYFVFSFTMCCCDIAPTFVPSRIMCMRESSACNLKCVEVRWLGGQDTGTSCVSGCSCNLFLSSLHGDWVGAVATCTLHAHGLCNGCWVMSAESRSCQTEEPRWAKSGGGSVWLHRCKYWSFFWWFNSSEREIWQARSVTIIYRNDMSNLWMCVWMCQCHLCL